MKKLTTVILLLALSFCTFAEERRVYYLDVTASMTGFNGSENIWSIVTNNLKSAIRAIPDGSTEIVIKTFTDANHPVTKIASEKATKEGKDKICKSIDNLDPSKNTNCHTDIFVPFEDFYKHETTLTKVDYFFLMTDGNQASSGANKLASAIKKWNKKTDNGEKHIYGFYVMLCDAAYSQNIENMVAPQKHLWTVKSANVNINLIRPEKTSFVCNIREKKKRYIDIPMSGNISNVGISVKGENDYCQVAKTEVKGSDLRVYLSLKKKHLSQIPQLSSLDLKITMPQRNFTYLLAGDINVHCDNLTPWAKIGISIAAIIILLLLGWFLLIKPIKYRTFKTLRKQMLLQKNGKILEQKNLIFTGARQVVISNQIVKQSFLNRLFTGKIVTYISNEVTSPLTFLPMRNRKDAFVRNLGWTIEPNPIPKSGVAQLKNQELGIQITLN